MFADEDSYYDSGIDHVYSEYDISESGYVVLVHPDEHICLITEMNRAMESMMRFLSSKTGLWNIYHITTP